MAGGDTPGVILPYSLVLAGSTRATVRATDPEPVILMTHACDTKGSIFGRLLAQNLAQRQLGDMDSVNDYYSF